MIVFGKRDGLNSQAIDTECSRDNLCEWCAFELRLWKGSKRPLPYNCADRLRQAKMAAELLAKMEGEPQSEEERLREAVKRSFIKERKRKAAVEKAIEEARAGDKSEKGGE